MVPAGFYLEKELPCCDTDVHRQPPRLLRAEHLRGAPQVSSHCPFQFPELSVAQGPHIHLVWEHCSSLSHACSDQPVSGPSTSVTRAVLASLYLLSSYTLSCQSFSRSLSTHEPILTALSLLASVAILCTWSSH